MLSKSKQNLLSTLKLYLSTEFSNIKTVQVQGRAFSKSSPCSIRNVHVCRPPFPNSCITRDFNKPQENICSFGSNISKAHYAIVGHELGTQRGIPQFSVVTPGKLSARRTVPDHIKTPDYYLTGSITPLNFSEPEIKTEEQVEKLRASCKLARAILTKVVSHAKAGVTTDELDSLCHELIISHDAYPSPLNYKNFPKSICTSVNNCACHGIPDDRKLVDGDIVNIDVTVYFNGYHGDCSETVCIGNVDAPGRKLVDVARACMYEGISVCGPNVPFYLIGMAIQNKAEENDCSIVPSFAGHGIGEYFHGPPDIYHFDYDCPGIMKPGMTFTVEPVVSEGGSEIRILSDGWTALTRDDSRTAQFEHTILITPTGKEILT